MNPAEVDISSLKDYTPEEIGKELFTKEPKPPCSCQMISEAQCIDTTFLFEILLIILMEGLESLTGDFSKADLHLMTKEHLTMLNPWFQSLGFDMFVDVYSKNDIEFYEGYYCKIIIRDKLYDIVFQTKHIEKNYHFFLNGDYLEENRKKNNLNDLHAVFINNDQIYKIEFKFHYPKL